MQPIAESSSDGIDAPPKPILLVQIIRQIDDRRRSLKVGRRRMNRCRKTRQQEKRQITETVAKKS